MQQLKKPLETAGKTIPPFKYRVIIEPLGLLYGSAGRFLSPDNLVGRSGTQFPPSAAALSGIFAAQLSQENRQEDLITLQLAGPFWGDSQHDIYVPTPFNCLIEDDRVKYYLKWNEEKWLGEGEVGKYKSGTWLALEDWPKLEPNLKVKAAPWKFSPHLHPRLKDEERHTREGDLFLENGVQLDSDAFLVYLSNIDIPEGWYRFGGEGHLVNLYCQELSESQKDLLSQPLGDSFCLITPGVWGNSNRLSYRAPEKRGNDLYWDNIKVAALFTQRPQPLRYRFGKYKEEVSDKIPKILARGRYAVPAGSVYILEQPVTTNWHDLPESLFPVEGVSLKRWGCGLALPIQAKDM
jgi:CRISPR-associated protein Cmr3